MIFPVSNNTWDKNMHTVTVTWAQWICFEMNKVELKKTQLDSVQPITSEMSGFYWTARISFVQSQQRNCENILTFSQEWRYVAVHQFFGDQFKVGHLVVSHGLEGAMFCYLLDDFLTEIALKKIWHTPESCREVLNEGHMETCSSVYGTQMIGFMFS